MAQVAREAIAQAGRDVRAGRSLRAQQSITTAAIAVDKLSILERQLAEFELRHISLAEGQAQRLVAAMRTLVQALGLSDVPAVARLVGDLFHQAGVDGVLVASPADVQEARDAIRRRVVSELPKSLPAPPESSGEPVCGPPSARPGGRNTLGPPQGLTAPPTEEEVVTGELVEDRPSVEELAKAVADRFAAEEFERSFGGARGRWDFDRRAY